MNLPLPLALVLILLCLPGRARAQASDSLASPRSSILSISPAELWFKTMVGYEHALGQRGSLGVLASHHKGNAGLYQGGQLTGYYRRFLTGQFPTGLYLQAQASAFNFTQEANLYNMETRKSTVLKYDGLSAGAGVGVGYRTYLLPQALGKRLLANAMLGARAQARPQAAYDPTVYRPELSLVGDGDDFNWRMGFSPGSIVHGLLTLDYQF